MPEYQYEYERWENARRNLHVGGGGGVLGGGGGGVVPPPPPPPPLHVFEEAPLQLSTDGRSESIRMDWVHQKFPRIFREEQRRLIRIDPNRFTSRCETPPPPPLPTTTQNLVPPPPPPPPNTSSPFCTLLPAPVAHWAKVTKVDEHWLRRRRPRSS